MPRTHLTDKYCKPKVPPRNELSELLKHYKNASGMTGDEMARKLGTSRPTVSHKLNQSADAWNIGDLRNYCDLLGVPFADALDAAKGAKK